MELIPTFLGGGRLRRGEKLFSSFTMCYFYIFFFLVVYAFCQCFNLYPYLLLALST